MALALILIISFFIPRPLVAKEFAIEKKLEFIVTTDLILTVNEQVSLKNSFSQIYPTQYTYTITSARPKNITAHDQFGNILVKSTPESNSTSILLKFNQPSIGKDKITTFDLSYQLENQVVKRGQSYDLYLPSSNTQTKLTQVSVQAPTDLGPLVNYQGTAEKSLNGNPIYHLNPLYFSQPQRLLFGFQQIFDFELIYQLSNKTSSPQLYWIPIPPDTDRQKVTYSRVNPIPKNVTIDPDGNYLAQYQLDGLQNLDVTAQGQVKLFPINTHQSPFQPYHLQSQTVWPVNDPTIAAIASTLTNPKSIYDYVVSTLGYNYDLTNSLGRVGALGALANPQYSLCTEFTDLFITLSRAKGIPAREIQGYVYTTNPRLRPTNPNTDFLHAWPQYYDTAQSSWVEVDPTWGKTTNGIDYFKSLDLNHIVLVVHGQDSHNPPSPGFYKRNNNMPSVKFSLAESEINSTPSAPKLELIQSDSQINLSITNTGQVTLSDLSLTHRNWQHISPPIPPYGHLQTNIPLPNFPLSLLPKNRYLAFNLSYQQQTQIVKLKNPRHFTHLTITLTVSAIILVAGAIIIAKHYD